MPGSALDGKRDLARLTEPRGNGECGLFGDEVMESEVVGDDSGALSVVGGCPVR